MIRYAFQLTDFRTWLRGFSRVLKQPVEAGKIVIPANMGEGYIFASNINADISFVIMDFSLKDELTLIRKKSSMFGLSLYFNQVAVSDFFSIKEPRNTLIDKNPARNNIFMSSTNYELEIAFSRNTQLKRVGIFFSPNFIGRLIKRDILLDLLQYSDNRIHLINQEPITFEFKQYLEDIFGAGTSESPVNSAMLRNRILILSEKYLDAFLSKAEVRRETGRMKLHGKERDIEALKTVERILTISNTTRFPSINQLSRIAMMSTTKLKVKFKLLYGMKLYEFYSRNRMERAREMLQSGKYSVKQVGYNIGFTNLSNFAKTFKKEFGVTPKDMLGKKDL